MGTRKDGFVYWPVNDPRLPRDLTVGVLESEAAMRRIFHPGRRINPVELLDVNRQMVVQVIRVVLAERPDLLREAPQDLVGILVPTESHALDFFGSFNDIWPGKKTGGQITVWVKRELEIVAHKGQPFDRYRCVVRGTDFEALRYLTGLGVGLSFDIGASGASVETVVGEVAAQGKIARLIFASPCTSLQAINAFYRAGRSAGIRSESMMALACGGIFGMDPNSTYLSLQLPGTVCSPGALALSRACYPHPRFCHVGAGGGAANCQSAYEAELTEDEMRFGVGIPKFTSLSEVMELVGVRFPDDFGRRVEGV